MGIQFQGLRFYSINHERSIAEELVASVKAFGFNADPMYDQTYLELWLRTIFRVHPLGGVPIMHSIHFANFDDFFIHAQPFIIHRIMDLIWKSAGPDSEIEPFEDNLNTAPRELGLVLRWFMDNSDITDALFCRPRNKLEDFRNRLEKALHTASEGKIQWTWVENYLEEALKKTKNLFSARNGAFFGAAYNECQPGDQLWFLYGLNVPVLLRPLENHRYKLVGEAFVSSYMHGEILKTNCVEGNKQQITME
jgi:hypothetical protein